MLDIRHHINTRIVVSRTLYVYTGTVLYYFIYYTTSTTVNQGKNRTAMAISVLLSLEHSRRGHRHKLAQVRGAQGTHFNIHHNT